MKHALETISSTAMEYAILLWKRMILKQKRIQSVLSMVLNRIHSQTLHILFLEIKKNAVKCIALIEIQRSWRGHRGRLSAAVQANTRDCAIQIQTLHRGIQARTLCSRMIEERVWAACEMQRAFRGFLGRKVASNRLLSQIDLEYTEHAQKMELIQLHSTIRCVVRLQRKFRERFAMKRYNEMVDKRRRELTVEHEMAEAQNLRNQHRDIHNKQVMQHIGRRKTELNEHNLISKRSSDQAHALRRKIFDDNQTYQLELKKKRDLEHTAYLRSKRTEEWENKIKSGCSSYKRYCLEYLKTPATRTERQFRKQIKTLIKRRINDVLKRADDRQYEMELDEANVVAEKEVIEILVRTEKKRIRNESKQDLQRLDQELDQEAKRVEVEYEENQRTRANWIICAAARRWLARKELRKAGIDTFEKLFDDTYKAFFYRNKRTGEVSWLKPKCLGSFDLEVKDEWKEWCHEETD